MVKLIKTDRVLIIESGDELKKFIENPEKFLDAHEALIGLKFNGLKIDLEQLKSHDFSRGPIFLHHCGDCNWCSYG